MKNNKNINKKIKLFLFLFVVFFGIMIFIIFFRGQSKKPEILKDVNFTESVKRINNSQKMMAILSGKKKEEEMVKAAPELLKAWKEFAVVFKDNQPKEYQRTRNWEEKLLIILEYARKADELVKEKRFSEAQKETEELRKMYNV